LFKVVANFLTFTFHKVV